MVQKMFNEKWTVKAVFEGVNGERKRVCRE